MRIFYYNGVYDSFQERMDDYFMIAFEKISIEQYCTDWQSKHAARVEKPEDVYKEIALPRRSTVGSAGYDFIAPYDFTLAPGESITILTGIRAQMPYDVVLLMMPRSRQGMRYKLQLMNTIGVIDADYYEAKNEGHIMVALFNDHRDSAVLEVKKGTAFAQGIFLPYYMTDDDAASEKRLGGFGSTDKKTLDNQG